MPIKSIFVLGSTSLVAKEICISLAKKGCKKFHLIARSHERNIPLIDLLINRFDANVTEELINLEDENLYLNNLPIVKDYDLYLITAGTLGDNDAAFYDVNEAKRINKVNFFSLIPWLMSIVNSERLKKNSRLWVFSSVASDRGRPSNYNYGAAKAALTNYCEGLIAKCHGCKFKVRLIKAGYIKTPMTKGKSPTILTISAKLVSTILLKRIDAAGTEYVPWWWFFIMKIIRILPASIISYL